MFRVRCYRFVTSTNWPRLTEFTQGSHEDHRYPVRRQIAARCRRRLWGIRRHRSNRDVNELQVGSTRYLPVFLKGALIWTGDSHCRQGNGEVNLTALECSYQELETQPIVRKVLKTDWPWAETKYHWIFMGFDEELNQAMKIAVEQTVVLRTYSVRRWSDSRCSSAKGSRWRIRRARCCT